MINRQDFPLALSISAILLGCLTGGAMAAEAEETAPRIALSARVSVTEAIASAEKDTGGKVFSAALTQLGYEVDVIMPDGSVQSLQIDAKTGEISTRKDDTTDDESGNFNNTE